MKKSAAAERRIARTIGGKTLPRSGGGRYSHTTNDPDTEGGDIVSTDFLIEHKRCEPHVKSIGVKREWLSKVTSGAKKKMKFPAMVLTFENPEGHEEDWMLIPMSVATRVLGKIRGE